MKRVTVCIGLAALLGMPSGASAMRAPAGDGPLPNVDTRAAQVTAAAKDARSSLADSLGPQAVVSSDPQTGRARFVGRTEGFLTGPSGDDPARIGLGYVADHQVVFRARRAAAHQPVHVRRRRVLARVSRTSSSPAPTWFTGSFGAEAPLAAFDGEASAGTWTLTVADLAAADTGTVDSWGLDMSGTRTCSTPAVKPTVTTSPSSAVTSRAATLNSKVDANGLASTYRFQFGTTTSYGRETAWTDAGSGTVAVARSAAALNLTPGTTYHFRVMAKNSAGQSWGADRTCTTGPPKPIVETKPATSITPTSAVLHSRVNPLGLAMTCRFEYGPTTSYGLATPLMSIGTGPSVVPCNQTVTGLTPNTTYHFRGRATNSEGTSVGADLTLTTPAS